MHPFTSIKLKSEFETENDEEFRKDLQLQVGLTFSDFGNFTENRVGIVHLSKFSQDEEAFGNFGIGVHSLYTSASNVGNFSEFEFSYFFTTADPKMITDPDEEQISTKTFKLNFSSIFTLKGLQNFSFNPTVSLFAHKGQPDEGEDSKWAFAFNVDFGLIFTKGWKKW